MRVNLDLSAEEVTAIRLLAKKNHRTAAGEIAHVLLDHLKARGYVPKPLVETAGTGTTGGSTVAPPPPDDGHPF